jgi:peptidoglycan/LPS O-acetylase OafA/YrhL
MKWLRSIGKTSYSMYVFHPFIFVPIIGLLYHASWSPIRGRPWLGLAADFALCIGLTVLASRISWVLIENRFINLKHRFQYRTLRNSVEEDSVNLREPLTESVPLAQGARSATP